MAENKNENLVIGQVCTYLSPRIRGSVLSIEDKSAERIQEIRLRAGRPLVVSISGKEYFVTIDGTLTAYPEQAVQVLKTEIEETFRAVCEYSVYSYARELREGFITLRGGTRVGIAGTAVYENSVLSHIRDISSLCFRIPRQVKNCAASLAGQTVAQGGGLLLAGKTGSGKTTMLRDLCRLLGGTGRVSLIDTRGEIAGILHGVPQYDVGMHTDVLSGFSRSEGAVIALRVMAPDYIICDEIGTYEDAEALMQIHGCGVNIVAAAHAGSMEDIMEREALKPLIKAGVFEHIALLGSSTAPGNLVAVRNMDEIC
ncbi:MAG: Flp pilus assembly complex ATPase component TadA [Oscillospiraceae bacterium]|nr:Flp pilus assembly complex ATPase component TadA [Oscillospiraceae bacterium]